MSIILTVEDYEKLYKELQAKHQKAIDCLYDSRVKVGTVHNKLGQLEENFTKIDPSKLISRIILDQMHILADTFQKIQSHLIENLNDEEVIEDLLDE